MAEVAHVGEEHCNTVLVGGGNHFVITDGTARLDYAGHARTAAAVSIPSRNGKNASEAIEEPFTSRPSSASFNTGDFRGVHAAHLARANTDGHSIVLA